MAISVTCTCGKKMSVKDELAGKRGKCPTCGVMLLIPSLELADDDFKLQEPSPASTAFAINAAYPASNSTAAAHADDETDFKIAGAPLAVPAGQIETATSPILPMAVLNKPPRQEQEGDLICPRCATPLEPLYTVMYTIASTVFLLKTWGLVRYTPYKCKFCGPIWYQELYGVSRRTADQRRAEYVRKWIKASLIAAGVIVGFWILSQVLESFSGKHAKQKQLREEAEIREKQRLQNMEENEAKRKIEAAERKQKQEAADKQREDLRLKKEEEAKRLQENIQRRQEEERKNAEKRAEERARQREERQKKALEDSPKPRQPPPKPMPPPAIPLQPQDVPGSGVIS